MCVAMLPEHGFSGQFSARFHAPLASSENTSDSIVAVAVLAAGRLAPLEPRALLPNNLWGIFHETGALPCLQSVVLAY